MVGEQPSVSIIVPVYNVEKYLEQCIESILGQSLRNIEIILVDDGSKDSSGDICDKYARHDNRVRVIHKENGGLVSARKAGLELASGKYIAYVDGDDFIETNTYEVMYAKAIQEDADVVIVGYLADDGVNQICKVNDASSGVYKNKDLEDLYMQMICSGTFYVPGIIPSLCTKLFKKETLFNCQMSVPDEIQMGEDVACSYRAILNANVVVIDNDFCPYHYRYVATSMSKGVDENYFQRIFLLYNYLKTSLNSRFNIDVQLEYYLAYLIRGGINRIFGKRSVLSWEQKYAYVSKLEEENIKRENGVKILLPWYISVERFLCKKKMYGLLIYFLRISNWLLSRK